MLHRWSQCARDWCRQFAEAQGQGRRTGQIAATAQAIRQELGRQCIHNAPLRWSDSAAHDLRIEPAAAALAQNLHGHGGTALEGEDVKMLRDGHDTGEGRDGGSGGTLRITAAVPVFIEGADGQRGLLAQADFAHDAGAAVAAHLNHFAVVGVLRERDSDHAPNLAEWALIGQDAVPQEAHGGKAGLMRAGPVLKLYAGFDRRSSPPPMI
jgi:hypothetical protein